MPLLHALPPLSRMAWMICAAAMGFSSSLSREAGPPPRTSINNTHFLEMSGGDINPTELVAAIINQKGTSTNKWDIEPGLLSLVINHVYSVAYCRVVRHK